MATRGRSAGRPAWYPWALAGVFALALALRLGVIVETAGSSYHKYLVLDAATYHKIAVKGDPAEPFWQPPLYPWMLRAVYTLAGGPSPPAARVFQALLGATTCLLVVFLVRRLGGSERAGVAAGAAAAIYGTLIYFDNEILPAGPAAFWVALWVLVLLTPGKPGGAWPRAWPLLAGLMLGAGGLLLPVLALPGLAALGWVWRRRSPGAAAAMALAAALVILPVTVRNWNREKALVAVSWNGGVNLWIGNNPDYPETTGIRPGAAWTRLTERPRCEGGAATRAAESAWFGGQVRQWATDHPLVFLRNLAWKGLQSITAYEIGRNRDIYDAREESRLLWALIWPAGFPFLVLLPLCLVGAVAGLRRGTLPWLPVIVVLGILAVGVIFFPTSRYRAPALPLMLALAGAGLPRAKGWDWLPGAGTLLLALIPPGTPPISRAETLYEIAVDREGEGKSAEAAAFFEQALALEPGHADAHLSLGLLLPKLNQEEAGRRHLEQALELDPRAGVAWTGLALHHQRRGDRKAAMEAVRKSVSLDPCDRRARTLLAYFLMDAGKLAEARAELEEAQRRYPRRDAVLEKAWKRWREFSARAEGGSPGRTEPTAAFPNPPSGSP